MNQSKHTYFVDWHGVKMMFHHTQESPRVRRAKNRRRNKVARRQRKVNAGVR